MKWNKWGEDNLPEVNTPIIIKSRNLSLTGYFYGVGVFPDGSKLYKHYMYNGKFDEPEEKLNISNRQNYYWAYIPTIEEIEEGMLAMNKEEYCEA